MAAGHDEQRLGVAAADAASRTAVGERHPRPPVPDGSSPSASTASPQTPQVTRSHGWVQPWPGSATPGLPRAAPGGASPPVSAPREPDILTRAGPRRGNLLTAGASVGTAPDSVKIRRDSRRRPSDGPADRSGRAQGTGIPRRASSASRWRGRVPTGVPSGHGPEDLELETVRVLRVEGEADAVVGRADQRPGLGQAPAGAHEVGELAHLPRGVVHPRDALVGRRARRAARTARDGGRRGCPGSSGTPRSGTGPSPRSPGRRGRSARSARRPRSRAPGAGVAGGRFHPSSLGDSHGCRTSRSGRRGHPGQRSRRSTA